MSRRFAGIAARLAGLVPRLLGWSPDAFWAATPAELAAILAPDPGGGADGGTLPLTRGELDLLLERESDG